MTEREEMVWYTIGYGSLVTNSWLLKQFFPRFFFSFIKENSFGEFQMKTNYTKSHCIVDAKSQLFFLPCEMLKAISPRAPQMVTLRANNFGFYCSKTVWKLIIFFPWKIWPKIKSCQIKVFLKVFLKARKKCFYEVATSFLHDAFCKIAWQRVKNDPYTLVVQQEFWKHSSALPTKSPKFYLHDVSSFWKEPTFIPALWKNIQFLQSHSIFIKKLGKEEVEPNMIFFWMLLHLAENWRMQLIFTFFVVIKNKGKNSTKIVSQGCFRW